MDGDPKIRRLSGERPDSGIWFKPALIGSTPGNLRTFFFLMIVVGGLVALITLAATLR